jgi:hypothetical protein
MKRRQFLKNATWLAGSNALLNKAPVLLPDNRSRSTRQVINAYYLRAQMYTIVPRQISEDMKWMADAGTNVVSVAVLEQDLWAAVSNIRIICEAAAKEGMEVWAVPSRWGGMVAGAPKVPSLFSAAHPETWIIKQDGKPLHDKNSAIASSIYHPETLHFFCKTIDEVLSRFPIKGVIWDEPKAVGKEDFSPEALKVLGNHSTYEERVQHHAEFFSSVNSYLKQRHPDTKVSLFIPASSKDTDVNMLAKTQLLDYYGCDGRPWSTADGGQLEGKGKTLLDNGPRFLEAAKKNNIKSLMLMENHNLPADNLPLLEKGIPEVLALHPDQLIYYYYPRNVEAPEKAMEIIAKQLKTHRE